MEHLLWPRYPMRFRARARCSLRHLKQSVRSGSARRIRHVGHTPTLTHRSRTSESSWMGVTCDGPLRRGPTHTRQDGRCVAVAPWHATPPQSPHAWQRSQDAQRQHHDPCTRPHPRRSAPLRARMTSQPRRAPPRRWHPNVHPAQRCAPWLYSSLLAMACNRRQADLRRRAADMRRSYLLPETQHMSEEKCGCVLLPLHVEPVSGIASK